MKFFKQAGNIFIIALLLVVVITMGILEYKQWHKRHLIALEINNLATQQRELQQKNQDLEHSLSFLNTDAYKEKLARQQLNLKKDGEIVVNFPEPQGAPGEQISSPKQDRTNPQKWWQYFFRTN